MRIKNIIFFSFIVMTGLTAYLWTRLKVVKFSYEHQELASIKKKLIEENRKLRLQYVRELSHERIEKYAKDRLGLQKPLEKQFRYIK